MELTRTVKSLIVINIGLFLLSVILPFAGVNMNEFLLYSPLTTSKFEWHQLLSHMFLHFDFIHIFFNMIFLYSFGPLVEDYLGEKKFLTFYLISGLGAALTHILFTNFSGGMLGASGAIFGIIGIYAVMYPNHILHLFGLIPIKAKVIFTLLILSELLLAIQSPVDGIGHFAHVGGAFTGILLFLFTRKKFI